MRTLNKNKQKLYYALQIGQVPIYETDLDGNIIYDHYTDDDGNYIYYQDDNGNRIPLKTGETEMGYSEAVEFDGNIAFSGGEVKYEEYGIDASQYDAILVLPKDALPIDETSVIWYGSEIKYLDGTSAFNNYPSEAVLPEKNKYPNQKYTDGNSADYRVVSVKPSLNAVKYVLNKIVK